MIPSNYYDLQSPLHDLTKTKWQENANGKIYFLFLLPTVFSGV